jgi:GDPmannose 4,6-dehydratase
MLQQDKPEDFVIASGVQHSVRQFIQWSASELGIELEFKGRGLDEKGYVAGLRGAKAPALRVGDCIVQVDPRYFRPAEVSTLLGDPTKAHQKLGWMPEVTAQQMCAEMVAADYEEARRISALKLSGFNVTMAQER